MKILIIYILIGMVLGLLVSIVDKKGMLKDEEINILDHILLITLWPAVLISAIINIFSNDDIDDGTTTGC